MDEEKDLFQRLVNRIKENKLDVDVNKIQQAYILANESHIGQKRKSGEDYILHPIEVAEILADMKRMISKADIRLILKKVGLDPDMKKPVGKYSLGMRQRLGIAQAIMEDPRFLILDEPFNGLDKHGVAEIRELLLDLKAAGKTILLASHNDEDIRILCDHVYEMDGGVLRERTA